MHQTNIVRILCFILLSWTAIPCRADESFWGKQGVAAETSAKDGTWYRDAKFAMFIHWGLYSLPAGVWDGKNYFGISEWIMHRARVPAAEYEKLAERFDPRAFDADAIAQLAADAGMRYVVVTAKHTDGFAMYDSGVSDYDIMDATPFDRDPIRELAEACRRKGLRFGLYYSQSQDWHERHGFGNTWDFADEGRDFSVYFNSKALPQVEELLRNYGEIAVIFFDSPALITREQVMQLRDLVAKLQPQCLVNSRIGHGLGDYVTLGDNEIPSRPLDGLWESIDTHNNSWAYSVLDINWKDAGEIIDRFVRVLTKGGNFMFNIGPKGDGSVPEESATILREVGEWMHTNREAIYNSRAVDAGNQTWVGATRSAERTYLFLRDWPKDGTLLLPVTGGTLRRATILASGEALPVSTVGDRVQLKVPRTIPDLRCTVVSLEPMDSLTFTTRKWVVRDFASELYPHEAQRQGVAFKPELRWMEIFGDWKTYPVLEQWEGGAHATWQFHCAEAGQYFVDIVYSSGHGGDLKEGVLEIGGISQPFVTVYTGDSRSSVSAGARGMPRFITRRLGMVSLETGDQTLSIKRSTTDGSDWISLHKIVITPAE